MGKKDVMEFEYHLEDEIFRLYNELISCKYRHGPYSTFNIWDPKHRIISKASVRDRLIHHLAFRELYKIFDSIFIYHSYSSRIGRGTHLAVRNLAYSLRKASRNYTRTVYVLKCDIKRFFHSISHRILLQIIENKIRNRNLLWLVGEIIDSFRSKPAGGG